MNNAVNEVANANAVNAVNNAVNAVNKANATAINKISQIGTTIKNIGTTRENIDISWNTIGIIALMGFFYMVTASIGINVFSKCTKLKDNSLHQNLNSVVVATLGIALAIPMTLGMAKMFADETSAFMLLYAVMGIIGSAIAFNWTLKCEGSAKDSRNFVGVTMGSFVSMLMGAIYLIYLGRK
jgi:uncharacterized membrane protein YqhA